MKIIYEGTTTGMGTMVPDFLKEKKLIIFNDHAPPELRDISLLHKGERMTEEIRPGDWFVLDGSEYRVTAVGDRANDSMRELGHVTLNFDGRTEPELPGTIHLQDAEVPKVLDEGLKIQFLRK